MPEGLPETLNTPGVPRLSPSEVACAPPPASVPVPRGFAPWPMDTPKPRASTKTSAVKWPTSTSEWNSKRSGSPRAVRAFGSDLVTEGRLDLPGAAEQALRTAGCERVDRLGSCTACNPERFFSHRRDRGLTGRQGAVAYVT